MNTHVGTFNVWVRVRCTITVSQTHVKAFNVWVCVCVCVRATCVFVPHVCVGSSRLLFRPVRLLPARRVVELIATILRPGAVNFG